MRPQRWQPTRLFCPWDSPGKNTGVGCHFLLQCMRVKSESEVAQPGPTSRPHGLQPTRLLRPWAFPGKSPGVGCRCLLRPQLRIYCLSLPIRMQAHGAEDLLLGSLLCFWPLERACNRRNTQQILAEWENTGRKDRLQGDEASQSDYAAGCAIGAFSAHHTGT